jgi:hypothetical protein
MIRFNVTWLKGTQDFLAELWVEGPDRQAIAEAADRIDAELANDAHAKGTAVSEGLRSLSMPPLHILYAVNEQDRLVEVVSLRREVPPLSPQRNGETSPNPEGT